MNEMEIPSGDYKWTRYQIDQTSRDILARWIRRLRREDPLQAETYFQEKQRRVALLRAALNTNLWKEGAWKEGA